MKSAPVILWFRSDLRLADNAALHAAAKSGTAVIPVFIWAPDEESPWKPGAASRWWLHQSLEILSRSLYRIGSRLIIGRGPTEKTLRGLIKETGAKSIFWNRRYEPAVIARDEKIKHFLRSDGVVVESFSGALLHEPADIANKQGKPFQVFTPFWNHCLKLPEPPLPFPTLRKLSAPSRWPKSLPLAALELEPKIAWAGGLRATWQPGEAGAYARLRYFLVRAFDDYTTNRDHPGIAGTSQLSPHLHFGEITPRQIWHAVRRRAEKLDVATDLWRSGRYLTEIGWREFSHHLLFHFPHTPEKPLRSDFAHFPWHSDAAFLRAWQKGLTGYPIVDAGMRELWITGWMHNRVRMIVASFLVKDLLISWTEGTHWFWDTLVDADLAQNTLGWQWSAGCGADAAPYFRIFNPLAQSEKFDAHGDYIRKWCPELAKLPDEWLHQPWSAPAEILSRASVRLGENYPERIVNHSIAREVALEAFAKMRGR